MTEKRFEVMVGGTVWDLVEDRELEVDDYVDLLNELHEENLEKQKLIEKQAKYIEELGGWEE